MLAQELRYSFTMDDFVEANKAHRNSNRGRYWIWWSGYSSLAYSIYVILSPSQTIRENLFPLLFGLSLVGGVPLLIRYSVRAAFAKQPLLAQPVVAKVTEEGLEYNSEHYKGMEKWPVYLAYLESPHLFLLYHSAVIFRMIPKRAFADEAAVNDFRKLVAEQVKTVRSGWLA